jgi:hypothetical protein
MIRLSSCIANHAIRHEDVWRSGCTDPSFLDLSANEELVVSSIPPPPNPIALPPVKSQWYTLDNRLEGLRAGLENVAKRKFLTIRGLELQSSAATPMASSYFECANPVQVNSAFEESNYVTLFLLTN